MVNSLLQTGLRKLNKIFYFIRNRVIKNKIICYFSMWNRTRRRLLIIFAFLATENDSLPQLLVPDYEMSHPSQQNVAYLLSLWKFCTKFFIFMIIGIIEFKLWNCRIIFRSTESSIIISIIFGNLKKWSTLSQNQFHFMIIINLNRIT